MRFLTLVVVLVPAAFPQSSVRGVVLTPLWQPVGDAKVRLTNLRDCSVSTILTDNAGAYQIPSAPGEFRINVDKEELDPLSTVEFTLGPLQSQFRFHFLKRSPKSPPPPIDECPQPVLGAGGGRVKAAKLTRKVEPRYPTILQAQGIAGDVVVEAVLDKEGRPSTLRPLSSPHPDLTEVAGRAISQWVYTPVLLNDNPVDVVFQITVSFRR